MRSAAWPGGKPNLTEHMAEKVARGNQHAEFLLNLLLIFVSSYCRNGFFQDFVHKIKPTVLISVGMAPPGESVSGF